MSAVFVSVPVLPRYFLSASDGIFASGLSVFLFFTKKLLIFKFKYIYLLFENFIINDKQLSYEQKRKIKKNQKTTKKNAYVSVFFVVRDCRRMASSHAVER